jgi:dipeptidyl aminopeptidase/acylaminoacyl peptidase
MTDARRIASSILFLLVAACGDKPPAPTSPLSPLSPVRPPTRTPATSPIATSMPQATQTPTPLPTYTPYLTPTPFPTFEPAEALRVETVKGIAGFPLTRLDAPLGVAAGPWSPDGRHLAVHLPLEPPGEWISGSTRATLVCDSSTGNFWGTGVRENSLLNTVDWLPDNRLVYVADGDVWMAEADGMGRHFLAACDDAACREVSPSPDGERILAMNSEGYFLIDVATDETRRVEGLNQGWGNWTWSDDGTQIALVQTGWRYYVIDAVNASATFLAEVPGLGRGGRVNAPSWVAGDRLLLAGEQMPGPDDTVVSYVLDPITGELTSVPELLQLSASPQLEVNAVANKGHLAVQAVNSSTGYFYEFETGRVEKMPGDRGTWSPAQPLLAFIQPRDQSQTLRLWRPGGGDAELIAPQAVPGSFAWSSDGSRLAYVASGTIWVFAPGGTDPPKPIAQVVGDTAQSLYWSPDGKHIAYVEGQVVWIAAADGSGSAVQVTPPLDSPGWLFWSPNSDHLSVSVMSRQGEPTPLYLVGFTK